MKYDMPQEQEDDFLSLSFLDVLSCGLGASILLFIIFAAMPHQGSDATVNYRDGGGADDRFTPTGAVLEAFRNPVTNATIKVSISIQTDTPEKNQDLKDYLDQIHISRIKDMLPGTTYEDKGRIIRSWVATSGFGHQQPSISMRDNKLPMTELSAWVTVSVGGCRQQRLFTFTTTNSRTSLLRFELTDKGEWIKNLIGHAKETQMEGNCGL